MDQAISILDSYGFRTLVWDVFVERIRAPMQGRAPDEDRIAAGLSRSKVCLRALSEILGSRPWLAGNGISLADLHAEPMFVLFRLAPEGAALFAEFANLVNWSTVMAQRPSVIRNVVSSVPPSNVN